MQAPEVLGGRYEVRGVLGRGGMAEVVDSASRPAVPEPASMSTSVTPPPPTTSLLPPPPPTTPVQVDEPQKKRGENGNGNGRKPKGGHGGD